MTAYEVMIARLAGVDCADDVMVGKFVDDAEDDILWPDDDEERYELLHEQHYLRN